MKRWRVGVSAVLLGLWVSGSTPSRAADAQGPSDFFPIGLYSVDDPEVFPEIVDFNFVQGYRFEGCCPDRYPNTNEAAQEYLDAAQRSGLKVLLGFEVYLDESPEHPLEEDLARIRERVLAFKDHPALFGWQLFDEPEGVGVKWNDDGTRTIIGPTVSPKNLRVAYETIKALDPVHSVSIANSVPADETYPYRRGADIFMPDYFPIPLDSPAGIAPLLITPPAKSLVPHIQAYNLAHDPPTIAGLTRREKARLRYPTRQEIRFMAYYALIRGSEGVSFMGYQWDYGVGPSGIEDISPRANPTQWAAVSSIAAELKTLSPILLAPTQSPEEAGVTLTGDGAIELMVKQHQGRTYLVTANPSEESVQQQFEFDPARLPHPTIRLLPDGQRLTLQEKLLTEEWEPYEVRIYEVTPGGAPR